MSEEMLDKIREVISKDMEIIITEGHSNYLLSHSITQSYLLLQILDRLEDINEKIAMMNINIQDVEQEVCKLNPEYK